MILATRNEKKNAEALLQPLAAVVGARRQAEEVSTLLRVAQEFRGADSTRVSLLAGLAEGLGRTRSEKMVSVEGVRAVERLLEGSSPQVKQHTLRIAGLLQINDAPGIRAVRAAAVKTTLDASRPETERTAALDVLTGAPASDLEPLHALLSPRQPLDLQVATVQVLGSADGTGIVPILLKDWPAYTPRVRTAIVDAICSRQDRLPLLLDAIEKGIVEPSSLPLLRQTQLLENPNVKVRDRANTLLARRATSDERASVLQRYQAGLTLKRDTKRGKQVFEQQCMKCHQLNGRGSAVGPDLAAAQNRPDESLLIDILDPSSTISAGYKTYLVVTQNGRSYSGVLAAETATSITLRREKGEQDVILRKDIDQMAATSQSLMPEGLEKEISPQDMANLFGYLREALGPNPNRLLLFDDEPAFVAALKEGEGMATLTSEDKFTGKACLRVTPPQRFAAQIPGWNYRIVEKPGPGEYRYLRLAWKTPQGSGVLLELADGGRWPAAQKPRCRIYSGKNTTAWKAVQISTEAPREWVVVTVDLWKQFGPLTFTGIAPTAMGGAAYFDRIELLQMLEDESSAPSKKDTR
jgi:putative heme-binding domain-containing protein